MKQSFASAAGSEMAGPFWERHRSHVGLRVTATSDRSRQAVVKARGRRNRLFSLLVEQAHGQAGWRSTTPSGSSPAVTIRHSAITSLRASATIIVVLRAPFAPSVRSRNHRASALSF